MQTGEAAWSVATDGTGRCHGPQVKVNMTFKRILRENFKKLFLLLRFGLLLFVFQQRCPHNKKNKMVCISSGSNKEGEEA